MNEFSGEGPAGETPQARKPLQPECPYCGFQPCLLGMSLVSFGEAIAVIFFCQRCEKILSVAPMPRIEAPEPSRVLLPS